jgi:hypothetical protein
MIKRFLWAAAKRHPATQKMVGCLSDERHWVAGFCGLILWVAINHKIILSGLPYLLNTVVHSPSSLSSLFFHNLAFEGYTIILFSVSVSRLTYYRYCSSDLPYLNFPTQEFKKLTRIVCDLSGIKEVFDSPCKENVFTPEFKYIIDQAIKSSKTVRIMSIAGYAYLGEGEKKSLLYKQLKRGKFDSVKVLTVDPSKLAHVKRRAEDLSMSWIDYERETQEQITNTKEQCKRLYQAGLPLKFRVMRHDPIFRLVIFDDLLLLSTYENDVHGHESPVYVIYRVPNKNKNKKTLFNSFCTLFDSVFAFAYPTRLGQPHSSSINSKKMLG